MTASPIAAVGGIDASDNWGAGTVLQPFTIAAGGSVRARLSTNSERLPEVSDWDTGNNNKPGGTVD